MMGNLPDQFDHSDQLSFLQDYQKLVSPTDKLPSNDLRPVLMGLFGEIGSVMATAKKLHRENEAYVGFRHAVEEEFGDALWYLTALCNRLGFSVYVIFIEVIESTKNTIAIETGNFLNASYSCSRSVNGLQLIDEMLLKMGEAAATLLGIRDSNELSLSLLKTFAVCYLQALQVVRITFSEVVRKNIEKVNGRFIDPDLTRLPTFDNRFPEEEQLPNNFEIKIIQRKNGRCHLQWNGVFIGDPLTDNIRDPDGFRYHDVFHLANTAILHWSPTFRGLIKQKRKSDPKIDEAEDGGRAIVVEEGLTAWIFCQAKQLNFFEGMDSISFDLLKTVQQFVQGYEVQACPLRLWERAILDGYSVFRQVLKHNGGIVIGCRETRTIQYKPHGVNIL